MAGLIVFEGIDGCGKSSVAKAVAQNLGTRAVLTREPTDSWIGRAVRAGDKRAVSPYTDALLFMADRAQHTEDIRALIQKGKLVISDRYYHSTVAYQTASLRRKGLGDNFNWLLEANLRISTKPKVTFVLDIDPQTGLARVGGRGGKKSRFEKLDFLREVRKNYLRLARADRSIVIVRADRPLAEVTDEVLSAIRESKL